MVPFSRRSVLRALGAAAGVTSSVAGTAGATDTSDETPTVERVVREAYNGHPGGVVRVDLRTLAALGVRAGDPVALGRARGGHGVPARVWRLDRAEWGEYVVRVDRFARPDAGTYPGDVVEIRPTDPAPAERVVLDRPGETPDYLIDMIHHGALGRPIIKDTKLPLRVTGGKSDYLKPYVVSTQPGGHVRVTDTTDVVMR